MEAIKFKECNVDFAKNQEEYNTLPAFADRKNGVVTTCYKLSLKDLIKIIFTRKIWLSLLTFNKPLTPQLLSVNKKDVIAPVKDDDIMYLDS